MSISLGVGGLKWTGVYAPWGSFGFDWHPPSSGPIEASVTSVLRPLRRRVSAAAMDILVELEYPALSDRMMQSDTSELEAEHGGPLQNCTNVSRTLALGEDEAPPLDEGAAVACRPDAASARGGGVRVATVVLALTLPLQLAGWARATVAMCDAAGGLVMCSTVVFLEVVWILPCLLTLLDVRRVEDTNDGRGDVLDATDMQKAAAKAARLATDDAAKRGALARADNGWAAVLKLLVVGTLSIAVIRQPQLRTALDPRALFGGESSAKANAVPFCDAANAADCSWLV